ncbi:MAG TPA: polyprenol monophosphomannose synthase [Solirubrobacteraceae bacterium]|jgi:dolichol-phosphate mannosyltransferase|nr:polyprenol monophosphomannose synthase [Solirubrobacteraceae bacterium]
MSARIWLVMPTYNEAENIGPIIHAVTEEMTKLAPGEYRVLVVDDNSPDGTGKLADQLAVELDSVEVMHRRSKDGLGRAYISGFEHALARGAELVIEMDADFSHDPKYLGALLAGAEDADVVLGSRYVPGGAVRNWGIMRKVISRGGSLYARTVLGVHVRDLTGGFKCIRRSVLETIDLNSLRADGYVFQIEVTYRAVRAGFQVIEVPITFVDRTAGASKMSGKIALEAMRLVPSLRRSQTRQLTRS